MSTTLAGEHRFGVRLQDGSERQISQLAAGLIRDNLEDPAGAAERFQGHSEAVASLVTAYCSCGISTCPFATSYYRGLVSGLGLGSVVAMSHSLDDRLRARRDSAPLLPSEINLTLTLPNELNVNLKPSPGVVLDYNADGTIAGTRPR